MSLTHIRLVKVGDCLEFVRYEVDSPDFQESDEWANIGFLVIDKNKKSYCFEASKLAQTNKMLPPEIYSMTQEEREKKLQWNYQGYGWGAWAMCINHWAISLTQEEHFPSEYP